MPRNTNANDWPLPELPLGVTAVMLPELDFDAQLDLCVELGVTHYVYRPRVIPDSRRDAAFSNWGNHRFDLTPRRLLDDGSLLKQRVRDAGLVPFGCVHSLNTDSTDEEMELAFRGAVEAGAQNARLSPPGIPPNELFDFRTTVDRIVGRYRDALAIAEQAGLPKIVIEIHTGLPTPSAGLALHVLQHFDPEKLGAILDLPNLAREGLTAPAVSVSVLGEYVDHLHVGGARRVSGEPDAAGFRPRNTEFCSLRESDLYIPDWLRCVRQLVGRLGRTLPLVVEDYTPGLTGEQRLRRTVQELRDLASLLA